MEVGRVGAAAVDCVIVGASTPELYGPLGEIGLERTHDGGRSCLELPWAWDELLEGCACRVDLCRTVGRWRMG